MHSFGFFLGKKLPVSSLWQNILTRAPNFAIFYLQVSSTGDSSQQGNQSLSLALKCPQIHALGFVCVEDAERRGCSSSLRLFWGCSLGTSLTQSQGMTRSDQNKQNSGPGSPQPDGMRGFQSASSHWKHLGKRLESPSGRVIPSHRAWQPGLPAVCWLAAWFSMSWRETVILGTSWWK